MKRLMLQIFLAATQIPFAILNINTILYSERVAWSLLALCFNMFAVGFALAFAVVYYTDIINDR